MLRPLDRAYDSFVVRLWHEPATGRLLRAEVEHIQTGTVAAERGAAPEWILRCLRECVVGRVEAGDGQAALDAGPAAEAV